MREFWIIGFGRVGRRALERLSKRSPVAAITVVDPRLERARAHLPAGVHRQAEDGVAFLLERLAGGKDASSWIIPAVPLHLAYEWLAARLASVGRCDPRPVPAAVAAELPNAVRGPQGQVFISLTDRICPESCNEPAGTCPLTDAPRRYDLHAHLAGIRHAPYRSLVIRSHQLAPGLGGFRGRQLTEALATVRTSPGAWLFSTASKCHGVMHAFRTADQGSKVKDQRKGQGKGQKENPRSKINDQGSKVSTAGTRCEVRG